jgi:hypothetical protein
MLIPLNDIDGILFQAPNPRLTSASLVCRISRSNSSSQPPTLVSPKQHRADEGTDPLD